MKSTNWKVYVEFTGIVAIVASLVFVGLQLRQGQIVAVAELGQSEISSRTDLNLGMSEFADIWDKNNRGEPLSGSELVIMESLIDSWFRRALISGFSRRALTGRSGRTTEQLFAVMLYQNPGARRIWEARRELERQYLQQLGPGSKFIDDSAETIRQDLAKLDTLNQ